MSDRKVKRLTPNSIANLVMADEAWHDSLYVRAEDYDSLLADFEALRTALAAPRPEPVLPEAITCGMPFVIKHYTADLRPTIKGNGFDGLEIGESREEAEEFVAWVNARIAAPPEDEALRRDAERYRYLRNRDPKEVFDKSGKAAGVWIDWEDDMAGLQLLTGDDADAAIDAAMQKGDKT